MTKPWPAGSVDVQAVCGCATTASWPEGGSPITRQDRPCPTHSVVIWLQAGRLTTLDHACGCMHVHRWEDGGKALPPAFFGCKSHPTASSFNSQVVLP